MIEYRRSARYGAACIALLAIAYLLSACAATSTDIEPTPVLDDERTPLVSVTGKLVPTVWAVVSTQIGGQVVEVAVSEGVTVTADDVLVRLNSADAEAAVGQARAALQQAEAELSRLSAPPQPEEIAMAETQVRAATAALSQTIRQRDQLWAGQYDAELAAAEAQIAAAQAEQLIARQEHDETMKCYEVKQPDGSKKEVCPTLGTLEERARFALQAANEQLEAAQAHREALESQQWAQTQIAEARIKAAEEQVEVATAQLSRLLAGAAPEDIAVAEAAVAQAEAALAAAEVNLDRTVIRAPFAGTVGRVDIRPGESIGPGTPLLVLGDLTTLRVETTDLDEIDVAHISEGQAVTVTFEALPDRTFAGEITHIAPMASTLGGGVTYQASVEITDLDPALRWGMTAFVDIEMAQ